MTLRGKLSFYSFIPESFAGAARSHARSLAVILNLMADLNAEILPLQRFFATQARYRFLLLDFVRIMRRIPAVQAHFRALFAPRRQQFAAIIGYLLPFGS